MKMFLDIDHSLLLLRASRRGASFALVPTELRCPAKLDVRYARLDRLGISPLLDYLRVPDDGPLGLLVPSAKDRIRIRDVRCRVCSHPRGNMPFLQLTSADKEHPSSIVPGDGICVYTLSPTGIVLGMARKLSRQQRHGEITRQQAALMLLRLCLELCGTYAHDPFNPDESDVRYGLRPALSTESLRSFLELAGNERGLSLAREVLPFVFDRSGSPEESFVGTGMFGPARLGGLALCDYLPNTPLDLDNYQQQSIEYRTITPDFQLVGYNAVIEVNGHVHEEGDNPQIDRLRMLDYQTLDIRCFVFTHANVRTQEEFMRSAKRLARMMSWKDGNAVLERLERLQRNESFRRRQRMLFEVFCPWLR